MYPRPSRRAAAFALALCLVTLSSFAELAFTVPAFAVQVPLQTFRTFLPIVRKSPPPPPPPPVGLVNGNFEAGPVAWEQYSEQGFVIILHAKDLPLSPHSGSWAAWLGGAYDEVSLLGQVLTVPAGATRLSYYLWIASGDACSVDYDIGGVIMDADGDVTEADVLDAYILCTDTSTGGWIRREVDISRYAGAEVLLLFSAFTDSSLNSNMFVDDVSLSLAPTQPETASAVEPLTTVPSRDGSATLPRQGPPRKLARLQSALEASLHR